MLKIVKQNSLTLGRIDRLLDKKLKPIKNKLDEHSRKLDGHSDRIDALTLDVIDVQKKVSVVGDIHTIVKDIQSNLVPRVAKLEELEPRVRALEAVVSNQK